MILFAQRRLSSVVAVEVKKSQHKYIVGTKGQNLQEILADTGVSVEVPPLDTPSDTITLRGDADKLGMALTAVYTKVLINYPIVDLHRDAWHSVVAFRRCSLLPELSVFCQSQQI